MNEPEIALARRFDDERPRLHLLATHLLGDAAEAEDVVQESWFRLRRTEPEEIHNLGAWLTTVVSRLALDVLRSARYRHEHSWEPVDWPADPEDDPAVLVEQGSQVDLALVVVLETLGPAERIAFVLHDVFGRPFEEVGRRGGRPQPRRGTATRLPGQAARPPGPGPAAPDRRQERALVEAWLTAVRTGDLAALLTLLDENAVLTATYAGGGQVVEGASAIAEQAVLMANLAAGSRAVLVDGRAAVLASRDGVTLSIVCFEFAGERIVALDVMADPATLGRSGGTRRRAGVTSAPSAAPVGTSGRRTTNGS